MHAMVTGLLAEGIDVMDATVMTTPGIAYLTQLSKFDLGIVISASHNPVSQNGIKLFGANGLKLPDADQEAIEKLIAERDPTTAARSMGYFYRSIASQNHYVNYLASLFEEQALNGLSVVLDCANGAATPVAGDAFHRLGVGKLVEINATPDGLNINVNAGSEHVRRDPRALHEAIRAQHADVGIAFDGDADRVVFLTPDGMLIDGDHILGILALQMQRYGRLSGNTVVATDMSNSGLEDFLKSKGISLNRTKVGDRYVAERMIEGGYSLGGEQAGHIMLWDENNMNDDGIYIGLLISSFIAHNKQQSGPTLDEMAGAIRRYPQVIASTTLEKTINLDSLADLENLRQTTLSTFAPKGRVNIRFSGTEPNLLRVMVEGGPTSQISQVISAAVDMCNLVARATDTAKPIIDIVDCATGAPVRQPR
jgi:phosphoglucosamine mutase